MEGIISTGGLNRISIASSAEFSAMLKKNGSIPGHRYGKETALSVGRAHKALMNSLRLSPQEAYGKEIVV
jgi:hypothetical protein